MNKLLLLLILIVAFSLPPAAGAMAQDAPDTTTLVYLCKIDKMIAAPLWRSVKKSFDEADTLNADYMLIHMNTYGGQVDIADSIRTLIFQCWCTLIIRLFQPGHSFPWQPTASI